MAEFVERLLTDEQLDYFLFRHYKQCGGGHLLYLCFCPLVLHMELLACIVKLLCRKKTADPYPDWQCNSEREGERGGDGESTAR